MNSQQLLAAVDDDYCLNFLARMVQHKSYSQTDGERKLAEYMASQMQMLGLETQLQPVPGERLNAIGTLRGEGSGHSLLFNGHLDTNPVTEGWTVDPWEGKIDDEFIYGIGVSNMKAGDAAYFCALKTLIDNGVKLKGDVILTYVVGELQGGIGTIAAIEQGIKADYFINSEPTDVQAMTMHAGSLMFTIELTGDTRHLSKREEAVDAIQAAIRLIPQINNITFTGAETDDHRKINRGHIGTIHGALGRDLEEWRPPQVADFVRLSGSARFAPGQTVDTVLADLQALLDNLCREFPGLQAELFDDGKRHRPTMLPFEVSPESPIVKAVNRAYQTVRGEQQPTGVITPPAFYGTDAAHFFQMLGMEGVVCGPGGKFNTMPDERVHIKDFLDTVRVYLLAILEICQPVEA
ncbi:acetylornithine deacetylase [Rahnella aquatilis CIP 78.65 = ATCC 33071]|uniref:Acetylornithine deacetylase/succinyldiaminopimelate desuccinylase-like deacylase n=1 Tax=Rahnella aquatilis (strain ATCC 33071 / DSM 4594 / JCM 1683 / NBRC 105701 / NCIMB 13365 / CIP 78.65) TaxID=745277 RepID=H2IP86_RAHAC|nr:M20/M25/M40 family metallo-hydrolase [Rahnella aquatilis]AEX52333.1 acetylornithine deacetylase/succinyldiaminopimelate desuccinylase-like deacylase [Rahnella aquatilis CIP 78.65 = ATCC 33071]KFD08882.1 acetylornithine deacetylase [Rahnella aquatilis CIP 78.65 = ATCC 33071]